MLSGKLDIAGVCVEVFDVFRWENIKGEGEINCILMRIFMFYKMRSHQLIKTNPAWLIVFNM